MTPMDAILLFSVLMRSLPTTLWLPTQHPPPHPGRVLVVLATPVKTI